MQCDCEAKEFDRLKSLRFDELTTQQVIALLNRYRNNDKERHVFTFLEATWVNVLRNARWRFLQWAFWHGPPNRIGKFIRTNRRTGQWLMNHSKTTKHATGWGIQWS